MSNADQLAEPTMDEILASIRKIIADDPAADNAEQADDDILDLSDALISEDMESGAAPVAPSNETVDTPPDIMGSQDVVFSSETQADPMTAQASTVMSSEQPQDFTVPGGTASVGFAEPIATTANAPEFQTTAAQQPAMTSALSHEAGPQAPQMGDIAQQEADLMADVGFAIEAEEASPISHQMTDGLPQMPGTDPMAGAPGVPGGSDLADMENTIPEAFAGTAGEVEMPSQMRMELSQATDVDRNQDFGVPGQVPPAAEAGLAAVAEGFDKPYAESSNDLADEDAALAMSAEPNQTLAEGLGSDVAALMAGAEVSATGNEAGTAAEDPLAAVGFDAADSAEKHSAPEAEDVADPESFYEDDDEGPVTGSLLQDAVQAQLEPAPQEQVQDVALAADSVADAKVDDALVSAPAEAEPSEASEAVSMEMTAVGVDLDKATEEVASDAIVEVAASAPQVAEPAVAVQAPPVEASPSVEQTATAAAPTAGTVPRTLEQSIQELLKPVLREWLDDNMPRIVEGALRDEMNSKD